MTAPFLSKKSLNAMAAMAVFAAGCVSSPSVKLYQPERVTLGMLPESPEPIFVRPIRGSGVDESGAARLQGVGSSAELTGLMAYSLRLHALPVVHAEEEAVYALDCEITKLGYAPEKDAPKSVMYQAELKCGLLDRERGQVIWERTLDRDYSHAELFTTMDKLPQNAFKHERRLAQYCLVPLWDAMSGSVWAVFAAQQSLDSPPGP